MEAWRWDLIRDACNVVLCIGILIYLVRGRSPSPQAPTEAADRPESAGFTQEIRLQALRQQSERALSAILGAVEAERLRLQQAFDSGDPHRLAPFEAPARGAAEERPFRLGQEACEPAARDRYDGVHGLFREGLSCGQIAEKLRLPRGEVELALKLRPAAE